MAKVAARITTSVDGYITGPNDGPERGLGEGGERLHYWVFGGPWTYAKPGRGEPTGADKEFLDGEMASMGAVIGGRGTFEAAARWGGTNPWPVSAQPESVRQRCEDPQPHGGDQTDGCDRHAERKRALDTDAQVPSAGTPAFEWVARASKYSDHRSSITRARQSLLTTGRYRPPSQVPLTSLTIGPAGHAAPASAR